MVRAAFCLAVWTEAVIPDSCAALAVGRGMLPSGDRLRPARPAPDASAGASVNEEMGPVVVWVVAAVVRGVRRL